MAETLTEIVTETKADALTEGDQFSKDGYGVTVHFVKDGEVYFAKYAMKDAGKPMVPGLGWGRLPVERFLQETEGAEKP